MKKTVLIAIVLGFQILFSQTSDFYYKVGEFVDDFSFEVSNLDEEGNIIRKNISLSELSSKDMYTVILYTSTC